MEYIRSIRVTVEVDTNKQTYLLDKDVADLAALAEVLAEVRGEMGQ